MMNNQRLAVAGTVMIMFSRRRYGDEWLNR